MWISKNSMLWDSVHTMLVIKLPYPILIFSQPFLSIPGKD